VFQEGDRFREYWTSYGFGELGASAETRRALLERLMPADDTKITDPTILSQL
jgi:hypothetical protein